MRIHEMEKGKIYKCPHCDYACNNSVSASLTFFCSQNQFLEFPAQENLRKHVLKTNRHPGKFLYQCTLCGDEEMSFKGNAFKEYQSHLQLAHRVSKAPA